MSPAPRPFLERFMEKVRKTDSCWLWAGHETADGYGKFSWNRGYQVITRHVHRVAYELFVGPIPKGLTIDHLCRNKLCVNPDHLEAVTNRENILRSDGITAVHARKKTCIHGHPLEGYNLIIRQMPNGGLMRQCRECGHIRTKKYEQKKKQRPTIDPS
jgi:hypothetical protein